MNYKRLSVMFFSMTVSYVILTQLKLMKTMDDVINDWSYSLSNPATDSFWRMFTLLGETETLALLSIVLVSFLLWKKKIQEIMLYLFLMSFGILLTFTLKLTIQRERPGEVEYIDFWGLGNDIISYSFPSGHAVKSFLLFGFVIWFIWQNYHKNKQMVYVVTLLVIGIVFCGLGQVFLHEHYISDVIGGYLIAVTIHFFSLWIYLWSKEKLEQSYVLYKKAQ